MSYELYDFLCKDCIETFSAEVDGIHLISCEKCNSQDVKVLSSHPDNEKFKEIESEEEGEENTIEEIKLEENAG